MTTAKNPALAKPVSVREFVNTQKEPVEVAGKVVKAEKINDALAKEAKRDRGRK